jgi:hypothetical protein
MIGTSDSWRSGSGGWNSIAKPSTAEAPTKASVWPANASRLAPGLCLWTRITNLPSKDFPDSAVESVIFLFRDDSSRTAGAGNTTGMSPWEKQPPSCAPDEDKKVSFDIHHVTPSWYGGCRLLGTQGPLVEGEAAHARLRGIEALT